MDALDGCGDDDPHSRRAADGRFAARDRARRAPDRPLARGTWRCASGTENAWRILLGNVFEADVLVFRGARDPGRMCAAALVWYQVVAAVVRMAAVALGQRTPEQAALPYAGPVSIPLARQLNR